MYGSALSTYISITAAADVDYRLDLLRDELLHLEGVAQRLLRAAPRVLVHDGQQVASVGYRVGNLLNSIQIFLTQVECE